MFEQREFSWQMQVRNYERWQLCCGMQFSVIEVPGHTILNQNLCPLPTKTQLCYGQTMKIAMVISYSTCFSVLST